MADWSDLPVDLLCLFAKRLLCVEDSVRFGAVCRSWRQAAVQEKKTRRLSVWLMLAELVNDDPSAKAPGIRRCYSLSTSEFFNLQLPELQGRRCWGTKYGWLLTLGLDLDIFLFNPLTHEKIALPSQLKFSHHQDVYPNREHLCEVFLGKFALSSDPSDPTRRPTIMITYGGCRRLAFAAPGDDKWTVMKTPTSIEDVVYFRGYFFCITHSGQLRACRRNATGLCTLDLGSPPTSNKFDDTAKSYLVEISGNLYLINRTYVNNNGADRAKVTRSFRAFKFDLLKKSWGCPRRHLDGYALFLGNNPGFAVSPLEYPQFKPNFIYYTDDYEEHYIMYNTSDMGIYDYESRTVVDSFDNCTHHPSRFCRSVIFAPLPDISP